MTKWAQEIGPAFGVSVGIVAFVYWPGAQSVARNLIIREAMLMFHTGFPVFDHERLSTSLLLRPFSTYIIIITSIIIINIMTTIIIINIITTFIITSVITTIITLYYYFTIIIVYYYHTIIIILNIS